MAEKDMEPAWHGPDINHEEPKAIYQQVSAHRWLVYINHGVMTYGPNGYGWFRHSEKSAKRKAEKELARYWAKKMPYPKTQKEIR